MADDERMTIDERYKYLRMMHARYFAAKRKERGRLLDEIVAMTGMNRKYVCHLMNGHVPRRKRRTKQRGRKYGARVDDAVRVVADALDWICAERLQPALAKTAIHLASFGELMMTEELAEDLRSISLSTLYRIMKRIRQYEPRLPQRRGKTKSRGIRADIPMTRLAWDISEPGHFEMDLVHHCGIRADGDYLCTLQMIDVATSWSERVAVYGRSAREMIRAFEKVLARCPFPIREIHSDNGSEFLNHPLVRFFGKRVTGVKLTRSRPYQKNDNRFVEQKNYTLVRAYLGHERLDTRDQCAFLNDIYDDMWVYYNMFQPVLNQVAKAYERTEEGILRLHRKYDVARTPLERLLSTDALGQNARDELTSTYSQTNPRALKRLIQEQLYCMFSGN
jgi:transposase InsO family protein